MMYCNDKLGLFNTPQEQTQGATKKSTGLTSENLAHLVLFQLLWDKRYSAFQSHPQHYYPKLDPKIDIRQKNSPKLED